MSMGRILSFFGSRSRCGTSQTALSLALKLADIYPEKKVLLIHMEEAPGDEYTDAIRENMGTIRPLLENGLWAADEIFGRSLLKKESLRHRRGWKTCKRRPFSSGCFGGVPHGYGGAMRFCNMRLRLRSESRPLHRRFDCFR